MLFIGNGLSDFQFNGFFFGELLDDFYWLTFIMNNTRHSLSISHSLEIKQINKQIEGEQLKISII